MFERDGRGSVVQAIASAVPLVLAIGHSGTSSSTSAMVEAVARLLEEQPASVRQTFDAIHGIVRDAKRAMEVGDLGVLGHLLDANQRLLAALRLSTPEIESMCHAARAAGALGAKLTGAGGGGCVVALVGTPEVGEAVVAGWNAVGKKAFVTEVRP
jgi:mevalonate kinase